MNAKEKPRLKKGAAEGLVSPAFDDRSAGDADVQGEDLTHWCISEGQLPRSKVKGKTRYHKVRILPGRCDCNNYYCQCGPNPELEAVRTEAENPGKIRMSKPTNASVLREAATLLKENHKQQEKILELLSASKNYLDYEKYLDELREIQEKEALVELEKKHLSGQLSYEEAILAKQRVVEENARRRAEYQEEKACFEEELQEYKEKEMAKVRETVRDIQEQHDKAKQVQVKTIRDRRKVAQAMAQDLKAMLRQRIRQQEQEIERKITAIREFKLLQQIKKQELGSREEKITKLISVSMEELKARLALYKQKMQEELMKNRTQIQKQKCRQAMIKNAASRFVEQVKTCREQMKKLQVPEKSRRLSRESRLEDAQLRELRAKLDDARMKRQSYRIENKRL